MVFQTDLLSQINIMDLYIKFRFKGAVLWQRVLRFDGNVVVGKVWNHPMNHGLLFGHLIGIPIISLTSSTSHPVPCRAGPASRATS